MSKKFYLVKQGLESELKTEILRAYVNIIYLSYKNNKY
jgi:hypothetical protein